MKQLSLKEVLNEMFAALGSAPEFRHAGVVFQAEKNELSKLSVNPAKLLLTPSSHYDKKILRESCRADGKTICIREFRFPKRTGIGQRVDSINPSLWNETRKATLSCFGATAGWVLVLAEAGGGAATVGATWAAFPLTLTATSAATFQYGVNTSRVISLISGNSEYNQWLNESPTFSSLMLALDVVQVADLTKAGLEASSLLIRFKRHKARDQNRLLKIYQGMTRENRKKLAVEILKINHSSLVKSQKQLRKVLRGQTLLDDGTKATKVYTQAQVQRLIRGTFYKAFLTRTSIATGIGTAAAIQGSVKELGNNLRRSVSYIIGISENS